METAFPRSWIVAAVLLAVSPASAQAPRIVLSGEACGPACTAHAVESEGLPAIDASGAVIAVAYRAEDGGRGNPNLTIRIHEIARDRVIEEWPILLADEVDQEACDPLRARIEQRIDAAHAALARRSWRALEPLDPIDEHVARRSGGAGLELVYRAPRLLVREPAARIRWARAVPGWSARPRRFCTDSSGARSADPDDCIVCAPETVLGGAWIDEPSSTLLVALAFRAGDLCDRDGEDHVLRVPRRVLSRSPAIAPR